MGGMAASDHLNPVQFSDTYAQGRVMRQSGALPISGASPDPDIDWNAGIAEAKARKAAKQAS